jgi:hypothetical protein
MVYPSYHKIHHLVVLCDYEFIDRIADIGKPEFIFLLTFNEGSKYINVDDATTWFSAFHLEFTLVHHASDFSQRFQVIVYLRI